MTWNRNEPFNSLPDLPPPGLAMTEELSRALVEARVWLARADQAASQMANPEILLTGISIVEAQASSAIENIVTTQDRLFESLAAGERKLDAATESALRYRSALQIGFDESIRRGVSKAQVVKLATLLMGYEIKIREGAGTVIAGKGKSPVYTPPVGSELISLKLDALVKFVATTKLDPLIAISLAHYQFEAIHPFPDGNGRVGRMLNIIWMTQKGVISNPVVSPSASINKERPRYYKLLEEVTSKGSFESWTIFMLKMFELSARRTVNQVRLLEKLRSDLMQTLKSTPKLFFDGELVDLIFSQPYCRIGHLVDSLGTSRPTAAKYLESLEEAGILRSVVSGRDKYFVNYQMLEILGEN